MPCCRLRRRDNSDGGWLVYLRSLTDEVIGRKGVLVHYGEFELALLAVAGILRSECEFLIP